MTDKEILQGIDRLDAELPFDEICVGGKDNWHDIDVHELLYEVRERIKWHYPSRGEYPTESVDVLCCFYGLTSFKVGWYDTTDQSWCFENCIYYKDGADNIIAWQYIIPPKEEA